MNNVVLVIVGLIIGYVIMKIALNIIEKFGEKE
jgi:uncharacterized membrane-anchored protein YhcB (DUF1043 family)